jgi:hypothetical protein
LQFALEQLRGLLQLKPFTICGGALVMLVGCVVGRSVGVTVGEMVVGNSVGLAVGTLDVGKAEGYFVGAAGHAMGQLFNLVAQNSHRSLDALLTFN